MKHSHPARLAGSALGICLMIMSGCHRTPPTDAAPEPPAGSAPAAGTGDAAGAVQGVTLTAAQVAKMGVVTTPAKAATFTPEASGYAVVIAHEAIAQAAAELASAQATASQSHAAFARAERLAGTAGALPADAQEAAVRQAAVDAAALALARQRLTAAYGSNPPWRNGDTSLLTGLADGRIKLVRASFPLGQLSGDAPQRLTVAQIDASATGKRWTTGTPWAAPADADVPGRSFFALLRGSDAGEGERLLAWSPLGAAVAGVLVPEAAAVISDGRYWCYVERKPGVFVRVGIDTRQPLPGGYFIGSGIGAGEPVVTAAAGQLLARELNAGAAAD